VIRILSQTPHNDLSANAEITVDEGLQFGRGVFETIRVGKTPYFFAEHMERLNRGLYDLAVRDPVNSERLLQEITALAIQHCVLKVIVTPAQIILQTRPLPEMPARPWHLTPRPGGQPANPILLATKNLNYLDHLLAWENARSAGFDDALLLGPADEIRETTRANIFWHKDGQLMTPDVACGLLDGVVRRWVLATFPARIGSYTLADLLDADSVFVTNSVLGIQPVERIGEHAIALNAPEIDAIRQSYERRLAALDAG
jgi:4-amino-4-deoxychorismate lyase